MWRDGPVEVRALGVGRLVDVEQAVEALHAEALARRGPVGADRPTDRGAACACDGPGGPIAGVAVHLAADGWSADVVTDADGVAAFDPPAGEVRASATAPGAGSPSWPPVAAPGHGRSGRVGR